MQHAGADLRVPLARTHLGGSGLEGVLQHQDVFIRR
jgi:hypothetical protein